jgi:hypothetical protein
MRWSEGYRRSVSRPEGRARRTARSVSFRFRLTVSFDVFQMVTFPKCQTSIRPVEFEVLTAVIMKTYALSNIMSCSPFKVNRCFGGTSSLSPCLVYFSTLMMEATCSFETSVDFQRARRRYIPQDRTLILDPPLCYLLLYFDPLVQRCSTFLYIGAHLTDGCGGAGAVWRFQQ